jgi:hypothetical protein
MIEHPSPQGTAAWLQARLGVPSASRFGDIVTPAKLDLATGASKYLDELLAEWMLGAPLPDMRSAWMLRGEELQGEAAAAYTLLTDHEMRAPGFCMTDDGRYGATPDGMIGDDGCVELKCPSPAVHVRYLRGGQVPQEYVPQVLGQLLVTGRAWCDFVSYYPGLPLLVVRTERDERLAKLAQTLDAFCAELEAEKTEAINREWKQ